MSYGGLIIAQDALSISGNVTDFEGHPISDCAVILMDKHFCVVDSDCTDGIGHFRMFADWCVIMVVLMSPIGH